MADSTSQLQVFGGKCMYCRRSLLFDSLEEHLAKDCLVKHSGTKAKGNWAQERMSARITNAARNEPYFSKGHYAHFMTPNSRHGFDDCIVDLDTMEAVESDTKNYITSPFDSSYLRKDFLNKKSRSIQDSSTEIINGLGKQQFILKGAERYEVKSIGRALVVFGRVERSCLTLCKQEGVEVIHEPEHCLPDQNEAEIEDAAKRFVAYAKECFIRRDNERAFERMWTRAQKGGWRQESKMIQQLAASEGSEGNDIPSLEEPYSSNSPTKQPIPEAVRQQAKGIYDKLVFSDKPFFVDGDLRWFCSQNIIKARHTLASKDGFTTIVSDRLTTRMNLPLYRAFVEHALYGDRPLAALWGEAA